MERTQRHQKRRRGFWKHRSLILAFSLFFSLQGTSKPSPSFFKQKSLAFDQSSQTNSPSNLKTLSANLSFKIAKTNKRSKKEKLLAKRKKSSKAHKKSQRGLASLKKAGWKIPYIKSGSLIDKIKLKKGDIIYSIEGQSVHSQKQFYKILSKYSKEKKKFSLFIKRKRRDILISYTFDKPQKKFVIADIQKIKNKPLKTAKQEKINSSQKQTVSKAKASNQKSSSKNKSKKIAKKSLVPKKYKKHLQQAYVITLNSFIYNKPDFDAPKLHPLAVGQKVYISKKIFRPPHNFGSFYKIFLFSPKKIVGYISEAEVATEFIKQEDGQFKLNPAYKLAQKQMKTDRALDINLISKMNKPRKADLQEDRPSYSQNHKKRYVGLSAGAFGSTLGPENAHIGLKLSGYNLLIPSLNMDLNLTTAPIDFRFWHLDILGTYPLIKNEPFYLSLLGGPKFDLNFREADMRRQMNFGVAGGLALMIAFNKFLLARVDAKVEYSFMDGYGLIRSGGFIQPSFLASLQIAL